MYNICVRYSNEKGLKYFTDSAVLKPSETVAKNEPPSLQFMQQQRKFEGRIPKRTQQTTLMTTLTASNNTKSLTDIKLINSESVSLNSIISSQNQQTDQRIVYTTMLPAATTLNGIPSHHQTQYITMQTPVTTLSPMTHTSNSPIPATTTSDGTVYQYKSEVVCDNQNQYQQQQPSSKSQDNHGKFLK